MKGPRVCLPRGEGQLTENTELGVSSASKRSTGICGMVNTGQSCYLNSSVQCVYSYGSFVDQFIVKHQNLRESSEGNFSASDISNLSKTFAGLLEDLSGGESAVSPLSFRNLFGSYKKEFAGHMQQDSAEFLELLLEELDLEEKFDKNGFSNQTPGREKLDDHSWKTSSCDSLVSSFFRGSVKTTSACTVCECQLSACEPFWILHLALNSQVTETKKQEIDLHDLLAQYSSYTFGKLDWYCPSCQKLQDAKHKKHFMLCPPGLIIHLPSCNDFDGLVRFPVCGLDVKSCLDSEEPVLYDLVGVINYRESCRNAGHYTCYCKRNDSWFAFDDSQVYWLAEEDIQTPAAYALFYECHQSPILPELKTMTSNTKEYQDKRAKSNRSLRRLLTVKRKALLTLRSVSQKRANLQMIQSLNKQTDICGPDGLNMKGLALLVDPHLNKGTAFTLVERELLGIRGLLPPAVVTVDEQIAGVLLKIHRYNRDLDKWAYLSALRDWNENLFYRIISEFFEDVGSVLFSHTVHQACLQYGFVSCRPRGIYVSLNDIGHVYDILGNWPETQIKAVILTTGESRDNPYDVGACGMGIPLGIQSLLTAAGSIPPLSCLPVVIDVGTDNKDLLEDPMYIGLKHKRVCGSLYDKLIDELIDSVVLRYGKHTLIMFEGFTDNNSSRLLEKYRNRYLTFVCDLQATAAVAVAGMISATKITKTQLSDHKYLLCTDAEHSVEILDLLVMAMVEEGMTREEAISSIWIVDSNGLVTKNCSGAVAPQKAVFAKDHPEIRDMEEVCELVKPTVAIGAAGVGGAFTEKFVQTMCAQNNCLIIFDLSSPMLTECTAEQTYRISEGRCIFASSTAFEPVEVDGKRLFPGQVNKAYIIPAMALAAIVTGTHHITDEMIIKASQALAGTVTDIHLAEGRVYPPLNIIRDVTLNVATKLVDYAYEKGLASHLPEPPNKMEYVRTYQYSTSVESSDPVTGQE